MEKRLIILYENGRKSDFMDWSEVMTKFNLTSSELENIIEKGILVDNTFFIDEALTLN